MAWGAGLVRLLLELLGELGGLVEGLRLVLGREVFVLLGHLLGAQHSPVGVLGG